MKRNPFPASRAARHAIHGAALSIAMAGVASAAVDASTVSMRVENNRTAVITYRLADDPAVVTLAIERSDGNGGWSRIPVPVVSLSGDVNRLVQPDASALKEIRWDCKADWPDQSFPSGSIRARVTAWAKGAPPDYMVVDLDTFEQRFYASESDIPGGLANDRYKTDALVMRRIPAGGRSFVMGQHTNDVAAVACAGQFHAKAHQHWVSLANDFYMAVFETTQAQHVKLRGDSNANSKDTADPAKPVDALGYNTLRGSDWPASEAPGGLLAAFRQKTGIDFDIPTEAEWEFACRAGTQGAFYDGSEFADADTGSATLGDLAWYGGNCAADSELKNESGYFGGLRRGGLKAPNAFGLYDMLGNVSEWCRDYVADYDLAAQPSLAPDGAATGTTRVKRGGNWHSKGVFTASSTRRGQNPTNSVDAANGGTIWANGYRLVCPAVAKDASAATPAAPRMVSVAFDLAEPAIVTLGAQVSTDGGSTWTDIDDKVVHVVGDVNRKLPAGTGYTALWNADADWPGHPADGESVRTVVRRWTDDNPPLYFVMSCADTSKRWYFTDERQIPGGVTNRLYKTDYLAMRRIYAKNIVWPMSSPSGEEGRQNDASANTGENPQHYVQLTNDYYIAVFPGTIGHSLALFSNGRSSSAALANWFPTDACAYTHLNGASARTGGQPPDSGSPLANLRSATGLRFDLATEAQWEFACRAGTGTARPFGDAELGDYAWHLDNSGNATHEVGLKKPNPWGLYDMLGNVAEWCRDFAGSYEASTDIANPVVAPTGPASNGQNRRRLRGGGFGSPATALRSAKRGSAAQNSTQLAGGGDGHTTSGNLYTAGYRLVIDLD